LNNRFNYFFKYLCNFFKYLFYKKLSDSKQSCFVLVFICLILASLLIYSKTYDLFLNKINLLIAIQLLANRFGKLLLDLCPAYRTSLTFRIWVIFYLL
jgi:hypothetical protein